MSYLAWIEVLKLVLHLFYKFILAHLLQDGYGSSSVPLLMIQYLHGSKRHFKGNKPALSLFPPDSRKVHVSSRLLLSVPYRVPNQLQGLASRPKIAPRPGPNSKHPAVGLQPRWWVWLPQLFSVVLPRYVNPVDIANVLLRASSYLLPRVIVDLSFLSLGFRELVYVDLKL
jgi:hypothetical protein